MSNLFLRSSAAVCFCLFCIGYSLQGAAQEDSLARRSLVAQRTPKPPVLDGILEPELYGNAAATGEFTNLEPTFGPIEQWPSKVVVLYDDRAIYVAAELSYPSVDSISQEIRPRDQIGNADWFGVAFDPYLSGVNGFEFIGVVTGGQFDAILSENGEDSNWDAVWETAVHQHENGWSIEMEIPYSALRFPKAAVQTWGVNFFRRNAAAQQKSFWSPIDPNKPGFVPQFGRLLGIENIKPPTRIQLTPFAVATGADYIDRSNSPKHTFDFNASAGADLKLGLSDAFTLDMTLIPDFSEARQDNQVLNLSPFEVQFQENRAFFTEGVELFNKGGFFYSRRVGGTPLGFSDAYDKAEEMGGEVISNPQNARLLNATKVSGRTQGGTGIGFFNAVSGEARALIQTAENNEVEFVTQPLTNYNVTVIDQILPNNGYVSLINTNVLRDGSTYDANLTGLVFDIRNKKNTYGLEGNFGLSQRYFADASTDLGHTLELEFGDIDGNWTWEINYEEISPTYNPSDLGFFRRRNVRELVASLSYFKAEEWGPFNRYGGGTNWGYERYIDPNQYSEFWFNFYAFGRTKGNWNFNPWVYFEPTKTIDRFEPRTDGMYFERPAQINSGMWVGSDQRKSFYFNTYGTLEQYLKEDLGRYGFDIGFNPSYRVSNNFTVTAETFYARNGNEGGYATKNSADIPVFGRRDRDIIENSLGLVYTVTPNLGFDLRARHYWSKVDYLELFDLQSDGSLGDLTNFNDDPISSLDQTFNALTMDLVCRWRFAPGSDLLVVWKDALFTGVDHARRNYFQTWGDGLMANPRTETLSIKINYWLDWNDLRKV